MRTGEVSAQVDLYARCPAETVSYVMNLNSKADRMAQEQMAAEDEERVELTEQERDDIESAEPVAQHIAYSGQDFDVNGLVRRLMNNDILVPTFGHHDARIQSAGFQRGFVWRRTQMDKFIESLLLGYPIPGIFLVKQTDNRYLVLDGQQRLSTMKFFSQGIYEGREFALRNVADEFQGLTYKTLPEALRRKFDNTFIQAILVTSDGSNESLESIYNIFERLNSGARSSRLTRSVSRSMLDLSLTILML